MKTDGPTSIEEARARYKLYQAIQAGPRPPHLAGAGEYFIEDWPELAAAREACGFYADGWQDAAERYEESGPAPAPPPDDEDDASFDPLDLWGTGWNDAMAYFQRAKA